MLHGIIWLLALGAAPSAETSINLLRGAAVIDPQGTISRARDELDHGRDLASSRERALLWGMGTAAINANDDASLTEALMRLDARRDDVVAAATAGFLRSRHNIANGLGGDDENGLSEALKAANSVLDHADPEIRAWARFQLCDAYALDEKTEKALPLCRQAEATYASLNDGWGMADAMNDQGIALMSQNKPAEAAAVYERARDQFRRAGGDELAIMVGDNLAQAYLALGRPRDALPLSQLSLSHELAAGRVSDALFSNADIAKAEAALGRPHAAYERIRVTVQQARKAGIGGQLGDLLKTESALAERVGEWKQALADLREVIALDAAADTPRLRALESELEQRYAARARELQIEALERANRVKDLQLKTAQLEARAGQQRQRSWTIVMAVVGCALTVISTLLFQLWRGQRRHAIALRQQALRDPLTGIANRRAFQDMAQALALKRNAPGAGECVLMLIDIDHFKQINDTVGHPQGDRVLQAVAGYLAAQVGARGQLARIGGEEFAVLHPSMWREDATRLAEELRDGVARLILPDESSALGVTISIGVALLDGIFCHDLPSWMRAADHALYAAKTGGRNRVVRAEPEPDTDIEPLAVMPVAATAG